MTYRAEFLFLRCFWSEGLDFGLAEEARLHLRERRGTPRWRAPEVLREGARFGKPADVWSFGCVAACVVMGMGHPYERPTPHIDTTNMCARALEVQVCLGSLRPSVPEGVPEAFRSVVGACARFDPVKRPCFESIWLRMARATV